MFKFLEEKFPDIYSTIEIANQHMWDGSGIVHFTTIAEHIFKQNTSNTKLNGKMTFGQYINSEDLRFIILEKYHFDIKKNFSKMLDFRNDKVHNKSLKYKLDKEELKEIYKNFWEFLCCYYTYTLNKRPDTKWDEKYFEKLLEKPQEKDNQSLKENEKKLKEKNEEIDLLKTENIQIQHEKEDALKEKNKEIKALKQEKIQNKQESENLKNTINSLREQLKNITLEKPKEIVSIVKKQQKIERKNTSKPIRLNSQIYSDKKLTNLNLVRNKNTDLKISIPVNTQLEIIDEYISRNWFKEAKNEIEANLNRNDGAYYYYKFLISIKTDENIFDSLIEFEKCFSQAKSQVIYNKAFLLGLDVLQKTSDINISMFLFKLLFKYNNERIVNSQNLIEMQNENIQKNIAKKTYGLVPYIDEFSSYLDLEQYDLFLRKTLTMLINKGLFYDAEKLNNQIIKENGNFEFTALNTLLIHSKSYNWQEFINKKIFEDDYSSLLESYLSQISNDNKLLEIIKNIYEKIYTKNSKQKTLCSYEYEYLNVIFNYSFEEKDELLTKFIKLLLSIKYSTQLFKVLNLVLEKIENDETYLNTCLEVSKEMQKNKFYKEAIFYSNILIKNSFNKEAYKVFINSYFLDKISGKKNILKQDFPFDKFDELLSCLNENEYDLIVQEYIDLCKMITKNKNATNVFNELFRYIKKGDINMQAETLFNFAICLKQNKKFDEAIPYLNKVLEYNEKNENVFFEILLCKLKCKNEEDLIKTKSNLTDNTTFSITISLAKSNGNVDFYKKLLNLCDKQKEYKKKRKEKIIKNTIVYTIFGVFLLLILILGVVFPIINNIKSKQVTYIKENGEYTAYIGKNYQDEQIIFEESINGLPVTKIATYKSAYDSSNSKTKKVFIPKFVRIITDNTFYYFTNLQEIIFDENSVLEEIGNHSFQGCSSLNKITIPNTVTKIGDYAFNYCNNLQEINMNTQLFPNEEGIWTSKHFSNIYATDIGNYAFSGCNLKNLVINSTTKNIGNYAFSNCKIENLEIKLGVETIGNYAFSYNSDNLTKINLPSSLTKVSGSFYGNTNLQKIYINFSNPYVFTADSVWDTFGFYNNGYSRLKNSLEIYVKEAFYDDFYNNLERTSSTSNKQFIQDRLKKF